MAEGPTHHKTIQPNLINYISHNLGKKADKEKEMEREKIDCKNSSGKGIKADRVGTNSASRPNRLRASAQGQSAPSTQSSTTKPLLADKCLVNNLSPIQRTTHQVVLYHQKIAHHPAWKRKINPKKG